MTGYGTAPRRFFIVLFVTAIVAWVAHHWHDRDLLQRRREFIGEINRRGGWTVELPDCGVGRCFAASPVPPTWWDRWLAHFRDGSHSPKLIEVVLPEPLERKDVERMALIPEVEILGVDDSNDAALQALPSLQQLRRLIVKSRRCSTAPAGVLHRFPQLEEFDFQPQAADVAVTEALAEAALVRLYAAPSIKRLSIRGIPHSPRALVALAKNRTLEKLVLFDVSTEPELLVCAVAQACRLRTVALRGVRLTPDDLRTLVRMPALDALQVPGARLSNAVVEQVLREFDAEFGDRPRPEVLN